MAAKLFTSALTGATTDGSGAGTLGACQFIQINNNLIPIYKILESLSQELKADRGGSVAPATIHGKNFNQWEGSVPTTADALRRSGKLHSSLDSAAVSLRISLLKASF